MNQPPGPGDPAGGPYREWQRTSPTAVVIFMFRFLRRMLTDGLPALAPLAAAFATIESLRWYWLALGLAVFGCGVLVWAILSYLRFQFRLDERTIFVQQGVVHHEHKTVDFGRVQNVTVTRPFYMRPLNLAVLDIDTAGSGGKEITLAGIALPLAERLRATILADTDGPTEQEPAETSQQTRTLITRDAARIVRYGLTVPVLVWVAVALGFLFSTGDDLWMPRAEELIERVASLFGDGQVLAGLTIAGLVLALILLLPLASVIGALVRHHGYELTLDGQTYRRQGGWLSRHEESLKRPKIQAVVWKQNLVARLFRIVNIKLQVTRAGIAEGSASGLPMPGQGFLVPALSTHEAAALTADFLPGCDTAAVGYSRVDARRFIGKALLFGWTGPLLAVGLSLGIAVRPAFLALIPVGYLLAVAIMAQTWRRLGYGIVGKHGFSRSGFIGTNWIIFPLFKVQRVDFRQTPGQRRAGLAHLTIHLASESMTLPEMPVEDARRFRDLALCHAESADRPWY